MATPEQILDLRAKIAEPLDVAPYGDTALSEKIESSLSVAAAASDIWTAKAAAVAHLVDTSEGGSSRKNSDLYKNYLALAAEFGSGNLVAVASARRTTTRKIVRD